MAKKTAGQECDDVRRAHRSRRREYGSTSLSEWMCLKTLSEARYVVKEKRTVAKVKGVDVPRKKKEIKIKIRYKGEKTIKNQKKN